MAKQQRAIRTRNALIESAAEMFHRDGFEVASLAVISARAGVSNGALHFHFASKAELASAVGEAAARRLRRIIAAGDGGRPGSALQELIDATHALVRALDDDVVLRAGFDLDQTRESAVSALALRDMWQEWVCAVLERAAAEGTLATGVSVGGAARTVVAVTVGLGVLGSRDTRWLTQASVQQFWRLLLPGLATAAARRFLVPSGSTGTQAR